MKDKLLEGSGNVEELEELLQNLDSVRLTIEKFLSRGTAVQVDGPDLGAPFPKAPSLQSVEFDKAADEESLLSDIFQKLCAIEPSVDVSNGYSCAAIDIFRIKSFAAAAAPDPDEERCLNKIIEVLVANDQSSTKCINFQKFKDAAETIQRAKGQRVEWAGRLGLEAALARYLPVGTLSDPLAGIRMMDDTQIIEACTNFAKYDLVRLFKKALLAMRRKKVDGVETTNKKFVDSGGIIAKYATLEEFQQGPEMLLGNPNPRLMEGMEVEHCKRGSANKLLLTPNYGLCTKSLWEWFWAVDADGTGKDFEIKSSTNLNAAWTSKSELRKSKVEPPDDLKERLSHNGKYPGEIGDLIVELEARIIIRKTNADSSGKIELKDFDENLKRIFNPEENLRWQSLISQATVNESGANQIELKLVLPVPKSRGLEEKLIDIACAQAGVGDSSRVTVTICERFSLFCRFLDPAHLEARLKVMRAADLMQLEKDFEDELSGTVPLLGSLVQESAKDLRHCLAQLVKVNGENSSARKELIESTIASFKRQTSAWSKYNVVRRQGRSRIRDINEFFMFEGLDMDIKKRIRDAKLRTEEFLALFLYTGPLYVLYNAVLRSFPQHLVDLLNDGAESGYDQQQHPAVYGNRFLQFSFLLLMWRLCSVSDAVSGHVVFQSRFETTIFIISSGIVKLARFTKVSSSLCSQ